MRIDASKRGLSEIPIFTYRCEVKAGYMATSSVCLIPEGPRKCHDVLS
jgi:hypothetical protein